MKKKIQIYTTPSCHYCHEAMEYFKKNKIDYKEYNVKDDLVARKEMTDISGSRSVPVITSGDKYIIGWSEEEFNNIYK